MKIQKDLMTSHKEEIAILKRAIAELKAEIVYLRTIYASLQKELNLTHWNLKSKVLTGEQAKEHSAAMRAFFD